VRYFFLLAILATGCSKTESSRPATSVKFDQYFVHGEQLYIKNCSNCHQKNGTGLGLLYPPINGSDYLAQHKDEVICLMRNGKSGELIVNGKNFNKEMPAIPSLTDLEIAEIATYIYNSWGRDDGIIEVSEVFQTKADQTNQVHCCRMQTLPWEFQKRLNLIRRFHSRRGSR
jgi:cytochrome c551